jgi:hypothetical protein
MQISAPIPKLELKSLMQDVQPIRTWEMVTIEHISPYNNIASSGPRAAGRRGWARVKSSAIHSANDRELQVMEHSTRRE